MAPQASTSSLAGVASTDSGVNDEAAGAASVGEKANEGSEGKHSAGEGLYQAVKTAAIVNIAADKLLGAVDESRAASGEADRTGGGTSRPAPLPAGMSDLRSATVSSVTASARRYRGPGGGGDLADASADALLDAKQEEADLVNFRRRLILARQMASPPVHLRPNGAGKVGGPGGSVVSLRSGRR